jgi:hypothetical protein
VSFDEEVRVDSVHVSSGVIKLGPGGQISGPVTLTNGLIEVRGARVSGPVRLKRGRLEVLGGSVLAGGLEVDNPGPTPRDSTYVAIHAGASVAGPVIAKGLVRLVVHPGANVGEAQFSGNSPEFLD